MINNKLICFIFASAIALFSLFALPQQAFADEAPASASTVQAENENCKYSKLQAEYMEGSTCWYCMIVGKMTSSYLYAASLVIPTIKNLALMILRYGFLIWLALYILKQVSSMSPISAGKFLQEILTMGFKVLLASMIVSSGVPFINEYIMKPVINTGIDIGNAIFDEIAKDETFNVDAGGES